jgi:chitinase
MSNIQTNFEEFHKKNPHIYKNLCVLARQWKAAGNSVVGIGMLFEVLRWDNGIKTTGEKYKLSNNMRSRYSRLIHEQEEDLEGIFRTKALRAY